MSKKQDISVIAIFSIIGEIDVQRGYGKPRTYKYSLKRAAMVRRAISWQYEYSCFNSPYGGAEKFRIGKKIDKHYH